MNKIYIFLMLCLTTFNQASSYDDSTMLDAKDKLLEQVPNIPSAACAYDILSQLSIGKKQASKELNNCYHLTNEEYQKALNIEKDPDVHEAYNDFIKKVDNNED